MTWLLSKMRIVFWVYPDQTTLRHRVYFEQLHSHEDSVNASPTKKKGEEMKLSEIETLENWLNQQEKEWSPKKVVKKAGEIWGMPKSTMEEWLSKQRAVEKHARPEVTPPVPSTEAWIRQRVSEKMMAREILK